jgi:fructan beta-fructosidase
MMKKLLTLMLAASSLYMVAETTDYTEPYRPQYHYSPAHRWIGDPSGLIKYNGKYKAYSWGAVTSEDLVHWQELNNQAIVDVPEGIATFTGSVVVDKENTAGYGKNTLIAAFTSYDKESKKQAQSIAPSRDCGLTFQYYDQNPVLDRWSTEFRDPTVVWDKQNNRWVMAVAKALNKKVAFYCSSDMKTWKWMSDFGPMGDNEKSWECPDLFQVAVDGDQNNKKWVLLVSVNWAREQYFVGDFNGTEFIPDAPDAEPLYVDEGLDYYASRVFQNYDEADAPVYTIGWVDTWDYANFVPTEYGKGFWSIPREYNLKSTPDGLRLTQKPIAALQTLRGPLYSLKSKPKPGKTAIKAVAAMDNQYEMDATFTPQGSDRFGLYLCEGSGRKVVVTYDSDTETLLIDRTGVADTEIPKFRRVAQCRVPMQDGKLRLHIFVDKASIEIFANDGSQVFTLLTFPSASQSAASFFTVNGKTIADLCVWKLCSVWG